VLAQLLAALDDLIRISVPPCASVCFNPLVNVPHETPPLDPCEPIAPAWHTVILLAYIAAIAWMSASSSPASAPAAATASLSFLPRPIIYATVLASEWILFGVTYWGLRLRRVPLRSILGGRWNGWGGVGRCLLLAAGCWIATFAGVGQAFDALGFRHAEEVRRVADMLLPRSPAEMALWVVVASTAGFVEEFVFRGYLQRQFGAWTGSPVAGILLSAIAFGGGHLYQGVASAAMIVVVGLCFSIVAHATRSIVPGMIAHGFEDLIAGIGGRA
jgi:membrane protease YdiL (CAAX protease family)